jgi:uncharacterized protein (DUF1810 family)
MFVYAQKSVILRILSGAKGTKDLVFLFRQLSKKENAPERSEQMFVYAQKSVILRT